MTHLWTIIFIALLAITFGLAARHDHQKVKRHERKVAACKKRTGSEE